MFFFVIHFYLIDGGNAGATIGAIVAGFLAIILVVLAILFVKINSNSAARPCSEMRIGVIRQLLTTFDESE